MQIAFSSVDDGDLNAPAKAHDDGVPRQTPAGKQRCNAIGDLVIVVPVDFG